MQFFLYRRIDEVPPKLQTVDAQHGLDGNGGLAPSAGSALRMCRWISANDALHGTTLFILPKRTYLRGFLQSGSRPSVMWSMIRIFSNAISPSVQGETTVAVIRSLQLAAKNGTFGSCLGSASVRGQPSHAQRSKWTTGIC